ncbi:S24/S26 family peptidase [Proteiniphilum sp.]|uniref:S24/S26 family peptidase n=1 Tax=Proteiniphilum sp. TaxID=1926877 RepID=UPI002B1EF60B|nr:S24/S26 family peptidase [Proteiniphilum sp.]MEA4917642.1 S24/S26 family peptidase [Proteiniphilum sp.]
MKTVTLPNEKLLAEVAMLLSEGRSITLRAKGNSMLPFIVGERDSVVLQKNGRVHPGDIVLAEITPRQFVLHRVIRVKYGHIILMGDGNLSGTEECREKNVHGRVVAVIRNGRYIACDENSEQVKVLIWHLLLPVRRILLAIYRRIILN